MAVRVYSVCATCTHAGVVRAGAACPACGASMASAPEPADLFTGWRCRCYHCSATPC